MTEVDGAGPEPTRGTAAHYMYFLNWAERKGELPAGKVQTWRIASTKVLEIEDDWRDVNVVDFDLDAHLGRFEILKRTSYTTGSMNAYKSRTKTGIEAYRAWLTGADWKPKGSGVTRNGDRARRSVNATPTTVAAKATVGEVGGYVPQHTALIEYPFPLRPGVRALIALPEDLTEKEARRIAKFVESLAFGEQLAITSGSAEETQ